MTHQFHMTCTDGETGKTEVFSCLEEKFHAKAADHGIPMEVADMALVLLAKDGTTRISWGTKSLEITKEDVVAQSVYIIATEKDGEYFPAGDIVYADYKSAENDLCRMDETNRANNLIIDVTIVRKALLDSVSESGKKSRKGKAKK